MESNTIVGELLEGDLIEDCCHIAVVVPGTLYLIKQLRSASVDCHSAARIHLLCNDYRAVGGDLGDGLANIGPTAMGKAFERLEFAEISACNVGTAFDHFRRVSHTIGHIEHNFGIMIDAQTADALEKG
jgi:hypothetical protein